jgi:NADPH-dependent ferric siderophore reductase
LAEARGIALEGVTRYVRGESLALWLERSRLAPSDDIAFYLAGHGESIQRLRASLRSAGWSRSTIRTKPYWADGKRGL